MWQERGTTSPWASSTYQPQPRTLGLPSTSQLGPEVLQVTVTTVPAFAARMVVLRGSMMSTPSWLGLLAGRNRWPGDPGTGIVQPVDDTAGAVVVVLIGSSGVLQ